MIIRQLSIFIATYFLREKFSQAQSGWIGESITNMFINKLSLLLSKSVVVIPLVVLGTVLGVFCYIDLMTIVDHGAKNFAPSFLINLAVAIISFSGAVYALRSAKVSEVSDEDTTSIEYSADPIHVAGVQLLENFAFFKRGFAQGFDTASNSTPSRSVQEL
jgi:hypothetical protein